MKSYSASMFVSLLTADQQQQNNFDHFSGSSRDITELNQEGSLTTTTTIIIDNTSNLTNDGDTRETWSNNCDYLITTLGGLIGLGKINFFIYFNVAINIRYMRKLLLFFSTRSYDRELK